jgi:hypothetical protein
MRLAVSGSRGITDRRLICETLDSIPGPTELLSGHCSNGVDMLAEAWARERGIKVWRFPADWLRHGRAAGPIRNQQMINQADALLAIWDGQSRGTGGTIDMARQRGIPTWVVTILRNQPHMTKWSSV